MAPNISFLQLSNPLKEYRDFLTEARVHGLSTGDFFGLPLLLIDLTSQIIVALISGGRLSVGQPGSAEGLSAAQQESSDDASSAISFIRKVLRRAKLSTASLFSALIYSQRLQGRSPKLAQDPAGTFLAALLLADKVLCDATYTNGDWAEFSDHRYTLEEINATEREFLAALDYRLGISVTEYDAFLQQLDVLLCLQQISWTSLSYRDLTALLQFPGMVGQRLMPHPHLHLPVPTMDGIYLFLKTVGLTASAYLSAVFVAAVVLHTFAPGSIPQAGPLIPPRPGGASAGMASFGDLMGIQDPFFVSFTPNMEHQRRLLVAAAENGHHRKEVAAPDKQSFPWWANSCSVEALRTMHSLENSGNLSIPLLM